jgi:hypothetical protein
MKMAGNLKLHPLAKSHIELRRTKDRLVIYKANYVKKETELYKKVDSIIGNIEECLKTIETEQDEG